MQYRDNVRDPRVWGPYYWDSFFRWANTYPKRNPSFEERKLAKAFYFKHVDNLPCALCNPHFSKTWKELPIDNYLDSRRDLMKWIYLVKDRVNRRTGKTSPPFGIILRKYNI